jgi:uncharacterized protein YbcV (DUF1398 family)
VTASGPVVMQGKPLVTGAADVPAFDREALIRALRIDQAGESTFPEFLEATWRAGVVGYDWTLQRGRCGTSAAMVASMWRRIRRWR